MPEHRELSRFTLPTSRFEFRGVELADVSPILPYFLLEGISFTDSGDLLLMEFTPARLQLHQMARVSAVAP